MAATNWTSARKLIGATAVQHRMDVESKLQTLADLFVYRSNLKRDELSQRKRKNIEFEVRNEDGSPIPANKRLPRLKQIPSTRIRPLDDLAKDVDKIADLIEFQYSRPIADLGSAPGAIWTKDRLVSIANELRLLSQAAIRADTVKVLRASKPHDLPLRLLAEGIALLMQECSPSGSLPLHRSHLAATKEVLRIAEGRSPGAERPKSIRHTCSAVLTELKGRQHR